MGIPLPFLPPLYLLQVSYPVSSLGTDAPWSEELEQKEKASEDANESRCNSVKKKYHLNRASISGKGMYMYIYKYM